MDNDLFQANNESSDGLRDSKTSNPETVEPITVSNAPLSPRRKLDWVVAGGVMIFVLIVSILLIPGWLLNDAPADILTATFPRGEEPGVSSLPAQTTTPTSSSPSESTSPPANTQQLTGEQQAMLDILEQKFPEVLPGLINKVIISDAVYLSAAGQAFYREPVFDGYSLTIKLILPDPRANSLDKLGISRYVPHSGAQEYIRENYEKLIRMEGIADWLEYPVTFHYQKGIGGENTIDSDLYPISFALNEYSDVFKPHIDQYITDMGFYIAALELLMPVSGSWAETDFDTSYMRLYLASLSDALEFKGIEVNGKTTADKAVIQNMVEKRLAQVWTCSSVTAYTDVFQRPQLKMRSLSYGQFLTRVYERLDADYKTGRAVKPSSFDELERAFLSTAQEMADGIFEKTMANDRELFTEREYAFDWEALGADGISACPELVEEMRNILFVFDLNLRFLNY